MRQYIVVRNVQLLAGGKIFRKNRIISESDVGEKNIRRYLDRGYIEELNSVYDVLVDDDEVFVPGHDEYCTPEQVNKMKKPELLKYAKHIGMAEIDQSQTAPDLRILIIKFISEQNPNVQSGDDGENGTGGTGA